MSGAQVQKVAEIEDMWGFVGEAIRSEEWITSS
jgi:hypothetical protein